MVFADAIAFRCTGARGLGPRGAERACWQSGDELECLALQRRCQRVALRDNTRGWASAQREANALSAPFEPARARDGGSRTGACGPRPDAGRILGRAPLTL